VSERSTPQRGLRFDKVALRLISQLQSTLRDDVPEGKTILVTVSAPIVLPAKTATAIAKHVRRWLGDPSSAECRTTINGNQICVRVVRSGSNRSANVLGFVHNAEVDTTTLLNTAQSSLHQ
jgi:hypothetical protein